jgi:hypothetical protein
MAKTKFDPVEYAAKKAAKAELDEPHTPPNSVPQLRARVDKIERILNVVPNP